MADNRIVTFAHAVANFFTFLRFNKSAPASSNKCMTKAELNEYYLLDDTALLSYANNQLIPETACKSGYHCGMSMFRQMVFDISSTSIDIYISVKNSGKFPVSIIAQTGMTRISFYVDVIDSTGTIVKTAQTGTYNGVLMALFTAPKYSTSMDSYTLRLRNFSGKTSASNITVRYGFACATNASTSVAVANNIHIKDQGNGTQYAAILPFFIIGANTPNFLGISWSATGNQLKFNNGNLGSAINNSAEQLTMYQYSPSIQSNGVIGTTYSSYTLTVQYPTSSGTITEQVGFNATVYDSSYNI